MMKIYTSIKNLDGLEIEGAINLDQLHPLRQHQKMLQLYESGSNVNIVTYSTYILEFASAWKIDVYCDGVLTKYFNEIFESLCQTFDLIDEKEARNFAED